MLLRSLKCVGFGAVVVALAAVGCSSDDDDNSDSTTGGTPSTGTGGTAQAGGGADPGTGGTTTDGGSTSTGGTTVTETILYDFASDDADVEILDYDGDYDEENDVQYVNLGSPNDNTSGTDVTAVQAAATGSDGESGVLEIRAPYYDYNQSVDVQWVFDPRDMSGGIIVARIMVVDGFVNAEGAGGGGFVFVKSGTGEDWIFGQGGWTNLEQDDYGAWIEFEMRVDEPDYSDAGYDPTAIRAVGVQVSTGGAVVETLPEPATIYVDQIAVF